MGRRLIDRELRKRRHRKEKLRKLREKFKLTRTEEEKSKIIAKVTKISPSLKIEDFLSSIK